MGPPQYAPAPASVKKSVLIYDNFYMVPAFNPLMSEQIFFTLLAQEG